MRCSLFALDGSSLRVFWLAFNRGHFCFVSDSFLAGQNANNHLVDDSQVERPIQVCGCALWPLERYRCGQRLAYRHHLGRLEILDLIMEHINGKLLKVGGIVRIKSEHLGQNMPFGHAVWKVSGIHYGATNKEDLISLKRLDFDSGSAFGKTQEDSIIPVDVLMSHPNIEIL